MVKPLKMFDTTYLERHCETEEEKKKLRAIKRDCKVKQIGGDDGYHYCFIYKDRPTYQGQTRTQAYADMNRAIRNLMEGRRWDAS